MTPVTQNMTAFLATIRHSEGTDKALDPYRVTFGYQHTIADMSNHPACTGEWLGERLPDQMCVDAGLTPPCKSTAAGAYQITRPTWVAWKNILSLPDFSPASQDQCAIAIIQNKDALELVNSGQIAEAVPLLRHTWASLPGSPSGQPQLTMASLLDTYVSFGGGYA